MYTHMCLHTHTHILAYIAYIDGVTVSKTKPRMSQHKLLYGETASGSLKK